MKKFKKWAAYTVITLLLVVVAAVSYITLALPNVGEPKDIKVDLTPQRIARGKYLANYVAVCIDCHSTRKWGEFAGPIDTTHIGAGGEHFDQNIGFPGDVYVPNITPSNLKTWTDGELYRAITTGVRKDGSAIFPIMPYSSYGKMDQEDIYSIIAYIRTLKPYNNTYPARKLDFPLNVIVHTMPGKAAETTRPAEKDTVAYGKYLITTAACADCHTKDKGLDYGGGAEFGMPGGTVRSANLTADATGIGAWSREMFIAKFKQYSGNAKTHAVKPGQFQTVMPWYRYSNMSVNDLGAIYTYLRSVKPVKNKVVKFSVKQNTKG
ncbi:cytochrome C [Mucilaginibacter conchicola]|uniref:Cytochrome C n=1 Tax=Mucilaginibacter conchicola TaxID=2303333 RepID=A0A372NYL6_9SPHI|nr:c-type cytochrome [Mucilaginibacter conchicola]RFZ94984.1 cytochrome C [Mucilaginibacter conchicola]